MRVPPHLYTLKPPAVIIDSRSAEFKGIPMSSDIFFALYMLNLVEC